MSAKIFATIFMIIRDNRPCIVVVVAALVKPAKTKY